MQKQLLSFSIFHSKLQRYILIPAMIVLLLPAGGCRLRNEGLEIQEAVVSPAEDGFLEGAATASADTSDEDSSETAGSVTEELSLSGADTPDHTKTEESADQTVISPAQITVFVCGEVTSPGVYTLDEGGRICDAVSAAGGFNDVADREYINLALIAEDGMKIVVPSAEETGLIKESGRPDMGLVAIGEAALGGIEYGLSSGQAVGNASPAIGAVNINTASEAELMSLPGIGQAKAQGIIAYRQEHGEYKKIDDIMKVSGIGEKMFDKIRDLIVV